MRVLDLDGEHGEDLGEDLGEDTRCMPEVQESSHIRTAGEGGEERSAGVPGCTRTGGGWLWARSEEDWGWGRSGAGSCGLEGAPGGRETGWRNTAPPPGGQPASS